MYDLLNFFLLQAFAMLLVTIILPGLKLEGVFGLFLMVGSLAVLNASLWDSALFHALPKNFTVHSATLILINGALFWVLVKLLPGISIKGVLPAIFAPLLYTSLTILIQTWFADVDVIALLRQALEGLSGLKETFLGTPRKGDEVGYF